MCRTDTTQREPVHVFSLMMQLTFDVVPLAIELRETEREVWEL